MDFESLKTFLLGLLAVVALYLPWVIYTAPKLLAYVTAKVGIEKYVPLDPITFLVNYAVAFSVGHLAELTWLAWGAGVFVVVAVINLTPRPPSLRGKGETDSPPRFGERQSPKRSGVGGLGEGSCRTTLLLYLLISLLFGYLVNLVYPFHPIRSERLLLFAAPAFYLLVALGIAAVWAWKKVLGAVVITLVALISFASLYDFYTVPRYAQEDYRPLIAQMQAMAQPGDAILAVYPWQIGYLETYFAAPMPTIVETPSDAWINNPARLRSDLDALDADHARLWLMAFQTQGRILEDRIDAELRARDFAVVDEWYGNTRLLSYVRAGEMQPGRTVEFQENVVLENYAVSTESLAAGKGIARVQLNWRGVSANTLGASLRLVDARGNLWAQNDFAIAGAEDKRGLFVPLGTPPGVYDLRLGLYRGRAGTVVLPNAAGNAKDISLAKVHVTAPASPNLYAISTRKSVPLDGVEFLGYDAPGKIKPGEPTPLNLYWRATQSLSDDWDTVLEIRNGAGQVVGRARGAPAFGIFPTTRWAPGLVVRDPKTVVVRGDTADGEYAIVVGIGQTAMEVGKIAVKGRPHYFGAPPVQSATDVRFGEGARLVGFDVSQGEGLHVVLYWQALAPMDRSYTVFVHLLDSAGNIAAQRDQIPGAGEFPTTGWVRGEYLADAYDLGLPRAGEFRVEVGLYDAATGQRLSAFDASGKNIGDHWILERTIRVP